MNWHKICDIEEIPERGSKTVKSEAVEVAIFRLSGGKLLALENKCPHKNGPLAEGIVSNYTVICPLHSWKINLEDGQVSPPDSGCVKTYPVKVEEGKVWLQLAAKGPQPNGATAPAD